MQNSNPIGIFDSGIGGLTVAHAVAKTLPNENMVYFGDIAHLPYGDKSTAAIQAYSVKICEMLLQQHCKLILIACYSASSAAFELVKEYVGKKAKVVNVIDPLINHLREHHAQKHLGLIGTKQTVHSNVFKRKLDELNVGSKFSALATPLLAPMIEEGYSNNQITDSVIHEYLSRPELDSIETLVLGCTHYPLIKRQIQQFYKNKIDVIDSSEIVANAVKTLLEQHNLLNKNVKVFKKFYVSDYTNSFAASAKLFFQADIQLEHYPLWD